jgi:hypothetical protein
MPVKIVKRLKNLNFLQKVQPVFYRLVDNYIKDEIRSFIEKGVSPVNQRNAKIKNTGGGNRYAKYSPSYIDKMGKGQMSNKKPRPVNLTRTGKMLRSIKTRISGSGVVIFFSDENAKYHNDQGAGKSKVIRRILPRDGEQWARQIANQIKASLSKAIKKVTK